MLRGGGRDGSDLEGLPGQLHFPVATAQQDLTVYPEAFRLRLQARASRVRIACI